MIGWLALHGGAEYTAGDEPSLRAILAAGVRPREPGEADPGPLRVVIVPTAAARGRPDLAGANGVAAIEGVAAAFGRPLEVHVVPVLDRASAEDPAMAAALERADIVHMPGGDPDLLPTLLPDTAALRALRAALRAGATVAGASAGAMALADPCWTPTGLVAGLRFVPDVLVVPHADAAGWTGLRARFGRERPAGVGILGIAERTCLIGRAGEPWSVAGPGEVRWLAPDRPAWDEPLVAVAGDTVVLD